MTRVYLTMLCVSMMLLNSCSSLVVSNFDDLSYFKKGMSGEQVDRFFDDDDMQQVHTFAIPNSPYVLKNTQVLAQFFQTAQANNNSFIRPGAMQTQFVTRYNTFRLLFKNDKLIYWGFDYEFLNNSDPEIRQIGEMMSAFGIKHVPGVNE